MKKVGDRSESSWVSGFLVTSGACVSTLDILLLHSILLLIATDFSTLYYYFILYDYFQCKNKITKCLFWLWSRRG